MLRPISKWTVRMSSLIHNKPIIFSVGVNGLLGEGDPFKITDLPNFGFYSIPDIDMHMFSNHFSLMAVQDEGSDLFQPIRMREECNYDFIMLLPLTKQEIVRRRIETNNPLFPFNNLKLKPHLTFNNKDIWVEQDGSTLISGRLQIKSFAGVLKFIFSEELTDQQVEVEIITYKLNYEEDFRALLSELAGFHSELILKLDNPTEIELGLRGTEDVSNQVLLLHLRRLMEKERLPTALQTIFSSPHNKTIHDVEWDLPSHVTNVDFVELQSNFINSPFNFGGSLKNYFNGLSPELIPEEIIVSTIDTPENRYVKFCLNELEFLVYTLKTSLDQGKFEPSYIFLESCERVIEEYLQLPLFKEIGPFTYLPNSMVMQKKMGYKDMLQYMQQFDMGIKLESEVEEFDTINGDLRPIHQLYEYWCFFKLLEVLEELCDHDSNVEQYLIENTDKGFLLTLKHRVECRIPLSYNGIEIYLYYNRDFKKALENQWEGSYDGGIYHPDFSIKIICKNQVHWLHFDSKYKVDYTKLNAMLREEREKGAFKQNDIHTAHAYRDAILGSRGVYILYPDDIVLTDNFIFVRQPEEDYPYRIPSVGAFPLRPGPSCEGQLAEVKSYLKEVLDALVAKDTQYNEETGFSL
ncbi:DUF2357 domain-containing protein [Paenibacillus jiagnxiensis]|uniref:DUF2357 domain-containing protein n=1 Tax=Paenibacillus jiagnxiensis TaxID=3228926 RepID=UPI0033AF4392